MMKLIILLILLSSMVVAVENSSMVVLYSDVDLGNNETLVLDGYVDINVTNQQTLYYLDLNTNIIYPIHIDNIGSGFVDLTINDKIKHLMYLSYEYDLNNNGENNFEIILLSIINDTATLRLQKIDEVKHKLSLSPSHELTLKERIRYQEEFDKEQERIINITNETMQVLNNTLERLQIVNNTINNNQKELNNISKSIDVVDKEIESIKNIKENQEEISSLTIIISIIAILGAFGSFYYFTMGAPEEKEEEEEGELK